MKCILVIQIFWKNIWPIRFTGKKTVCAIRVSAILMCAFFVGTPCAAAKPYLPFTDENCIRAILGEARSEGDLAMYTHACAIRHRKTLYGVYGATAQMEEIPGELYQRAAKAWYTSEDGPDSAHGATHWLSDNDRKYCRSRTLWTSHYQAVARVGTTTFYRRKKHDRHKKRSKSRTRIPATAR